MTVPEARPVTGTRIRWSDDRFAGDSIRACTQSALDVPSLVAALEAALGFHVEAVIEDTPEPRFRYCKTCSGHPAWPCPEVAAITRALNGDTDA